MINIDADVGNALKTVGNNVVNGYPKDWKTFPIISFTEETNIPHMLSNAGERHSKIRYRIDLWGTASVNNLAKSVNDALFLLGFNRTQSMNVDDENYKHKLMRFELVIDNETKQTYQ